jgi:hypothetical protein
MRTQSVGYQRQDYQKSPGVTRISDATRSILREFWPIIEKTLPAILTDFYDQLMSDATLAARADNQKQRLKELQSTQWSRLFSGRVDDAYIKGTRAIGAEHCKVGLEARRYVCGYALLLSNLTDLAMRTYRWKPERLSVVLAAVNSAVMLDIDLTISACQDAREQSRRMAVPDIAKTPAMDIGGVFVTGRAVKRQSTDQSNAVREPTNKPVPEIELQARIEWIDQWNSRAKRHHPDSATYDA